jgi:hypothetical protein
MQMYYMYWVGSFIVSLNTYMFVKRDSLIMAPAKQLICIVGTGRNPPNV